MSAKVRAMEPCAQGCSLPWWQCHLYHGTMVVGEYEFHRWMTRTIFGKKHRTSAARVEHGTCGQIRCATLRERDGVARMIAVPAAVIFIWCGWRLALDWEYPVGRGACFFTWTTP